MTGQCHDNLFCLPTRLKCSRTLFNLQHFLVRLITVFSLLWFNAAFLLSCKAYSDHHAYTFVHCLSASGTLMATGPEGPKTLPLFAPGPSDPAQARWLVLGVCFICYLSLYSTWEGNLYHFWQLWWSVRKFLLSLIVFTSSDFPLAGFGKTGEHEFKKVQGFRWVIFLVCLWKMCLEC